MSLAADREERRQMNEERVIFIPEETWKEIKEISIDSGNKKLIDAVGKGSSAYERIITIK